MYRIPAKLLMIALSFQCVATGRAAEQSGQPNVLMICIDDLNDWVGFLGGHPEALTPHMDALARRGRTFTNAHCAVPVCSCSRASVMSGVAATTHCSYEIGPSYQQLPALSNIPTIQRFFKDHGYYTLSGGKKSPRPKKPMSRPASWSGAWDWGAYPQSDAEMADFQLAQNAAESLQQDFGKPFFMTVGFFRPHVPLFVPPKWFDLYEKDSFTLPRNSKPSPSATVLNEDSRLCWCKISKLAKIFALNLGESGSEGMACVPRIVPLIVEEHG